jgi:glycosyltransferase involved in cell wall biosynthesis
MSRSVEHGTYEGTVPKEDAVDTVRQFFMLLFPTRHPGEGMAGTIIDALAASVPVIATDWNYNSEIVRHGLEGIIYKPDSIQNLIDAIDYAISHPEDIEAMSRAAKIRSLDFSTDVVLSKILCVLTSNGK